MTANNSIPETIRQVVQAVEIALLPDLQMVDASITGINYVYGTREEVRRRLLEMSKTPEEAARMYPLVALFGAIPIAESRAGYPGRVVLQMAIMHPMRREARPEERYAEVLAPILLPIEAQLLRALVDCGCFVLNSVRQIAYTRKELPGKADALAAASFDRVEGILLEQMKLTLAHANPLPSITEIQGIV